MIVELAAGDEWDAHRREVAAAHDANLRVRHAGEILVERLAIEAKIAVGRPALNRQQAREPHRAYAGDGARPSEQRRVKPHKALAVGDGGDGRRPDAEGEQMLGGEAGVRVREGDEAADD